MKIICQQKGLNKHLQIANRAVPIRPQHPVLGNILVSADADTNQLTLTGFDLSLGITTTFITKVIESGKVTIPAKLLANIVSQLPPGEITLSWEPSLKEDAPILINLTADSGKFQFSGLPAEEFPELLAAEAGKTIEIPASVLADGMKVLFAADNITIHHYALAQLKAILAVDPDPEPDYLIELQIDEDQVIFDIGGQKLYCRRIEGCYPAYGQLIPQQFCREAVVNRKELLSAVKLLSIISNNDCANAIFDGESGQIILTVDAADVGSGTQTIVAQITGERLQVGLNLKYLVSGLSAIDSTEVKIHLNEPNTPVIFTPLGGLNMRCLIMPVTIRE